ncbi:MAG: hypothetical protein ABW352_00590 [Polyangiales bacterium]
MEPALEVHPREVWTPALLDELHALAITMSAEPRAHFDKHANTNDCVHLFRDRGAVIGFQFWKALTVPEARLIVGGKLRIAPSYRRRSLHLRSGLAFYREQLQRFPTVHRLSMASLFGFASITRALAHYEIVRAPDVPAWQCDAIERLARESDFAYDRATGLVRVGIQITPQQLAAYPESFYASPQVRAYAAHNPGYRDNGTYLAFGFALSSENLRALERALDK